ncbi:sexual development protein [Aspergillus sp. HF37]|nr:sexual development protein [Aspergillus sp. HF37]
MQQDKVPSETPFPTTSDLSFAFSLAQMFTVRNSCPSARSIRLTTYHLLMILTPPANRTQNILVGWKPNPAIQEPEMWMTYINQLNLPVVVPLRVVALNKMAIAEAAFPYTEHLMNGLTIAAVTVEKGPFLSVGAVSEKTVSGPG